MKVRTGFVSNSSSTAFAICMTKDNYDKVVDKLPDAARDAVRKIKVPIKTFSGVKMVMLGGHYGDEEDFMGQKPFYTEDYDNDREQFGEFLDKLNKQPHLDWQSWA